MPGVLVVASGTNRYDTSDANGDFGIIMYANSETNSDLRSYTLIFYGDECNNISTIRAGDKVMAKTVRVINELDIFASDTLQEQSSAIGTEEWYYHKQRPSAIKKVIRQRGEL